MSSSPHPNSTITTTTSNRNTEQAPLQQQQQRVTETPERGPPADAVETGGQGHLLVITDKAKAKMQDLLRQQQSSKKPQNNNNTNSDPPLLYLRMGVETGGCTGLSYTLHVIHKDELNPDRDHVETHGNVVCVVDYRSLLYLYGMELDFSDLLIGGGFKFSNPNASRSCGCGRSFAVSKSFLQNLPDSSSLGTRPETAGQGLSNTTPHGMDKPANGTWIYDHVQRRAEPGGGEETLIPSKPTKCS